MTASASPTIHTHCGTSSERQSVGLAGHCDLCVEVGHVAAHPDLGCCDVGCNRDHDDAPVEVDTRPTGDSLPGVGDAGIDDLEQFQLSDAAGCYLKAAAYVTNTGNPMPAWMAEEYFAWPFAASDWQLIDTAEACLSIAATYIAAEAERLERAGV